MGFGKAWLVEMQDYHYGCKDSVLTEKLHDTSLRLIHHNKLDKNTLESWSVFTGLNASKAWNEIKKIKQVKNPKLVCREKGRLVVFGTTVQDSFLDGCFLPAKNIKLDFVARDGIEHTKIVSFEKPSKLASRIREVADVKKVRKKRIRSAAELFRHLNGHSPIEVLSEKELEYLRQACSRGYYDWPRKTNLKKLAKGNQSSLSSFSGAVRRAESKMLKTALK